MNKIREHFEQAQQILIEFLSDDANFHAIQSAGELMTDAIRSGKKIISCGNGGSMSDAMHFAEELSGRYRLDRPALPAISISDPSHLSCVGNDYGFAFVFSRMIEAVGQEGDILLAISTSGSSENVLNAIVSAKKKGLKVVGLTGKDGGKIGPTCDVEIRAPMSEYADRAQEIHIKVIHSLIDFIEGQLADS